MPSNAQATFLLNKADIDRLLDIHADVAGAGVGRKHKVEVLNRSAIVLLTACWEAYVEDVALEAFDFVVSSAATAAQVPADIQKLVAKSVKSDKHELAVWNLADGGWRAVLTGYRDDIKAAWAGKLNTPKPDQVNDLFAKMLAKSDLSAAWRWNGMTNQAAVAKLKELVTLRGEIAHRAQAAGGVLKQHCIRYRDFVDRLVKCTDVAVRDHVRDLVAAAPW